MIITWNYQCKAGSPMVGVIDGEGLEAVVIQG